MALQINYDYQQSGIWHTNNIRTVNTTTNTIYVYVDAYQLTGSGNPTNFARGIKIFIANKNSNNNWNDFTTDSRYVTALREMFQLTNSQGMSRAYDGVGYGTSVGNIYSLYPDNPMVRINSITKTDNYNYYVFVGKALQEYYATIPSDKTFVDTFHRPNSLNILYKIPQDLDLRQYSPSNVKAQLVNDFGTYNEIDQSGWIVEDMVNRGWTSENVVEFDYFHSPKYIRYDVKINTITNTIDAIVDFNSRMVFEEYTDDKHLVNYTTTEGGVPILQPLPYPMYKGSETIYQVELLTCDYTDNRIISKETICNMNKPSIFSLNKIDITNLIKNTSEYVEYTRNKTPMSNYRYVLNFKSIRREWKIDVKFSLGLQIYEFSQYYTDTTNFESFSISPENNVSFDYTLPQTGINTENNIILDTEFYARTTLNIEYVGEKKEPTGDEFDPPTPPDPTPPKKLDPVPPTPTDTGETPEPIPPQPVTPQPNPTLGSSGLYKIYELSTLDVQNLGMFLWGSDWYENLRLINNNPLENILWLKQCAFNFPESENTDVKLGNIDTGIDAPIITSNFVQTVGTFTIPQRYNSYLDLSPFTTYQMYLPFVGLVDLDPNLILGYELTLNVYVECTSMFAKYQLVNDENIVIGEWEFDSAITLSLSASNKAQQHFNQITTLVKTIGGVAENVAIGNPVGAIADGLEGVTSALTSQFHTQTSGSMTSNCAMMTNRQAYIIITRPVTQSLPKYNHTYGKPANYTANLSTLTGFTIIDTNTDLSGFDCTNDEMELIRAELSEGVII